jgi:hypothetical protein
MSFTAQYDSGICYECGMSLRVGDNLIYDQEGNLCHYECLIGENPDQPKLFDFNAARVVRQP